jgi:RNA polymerase sigma factor (sigma-70 family)
VKTDRSGQTPSASESGGPSHSDGVVPLFPTTQWNLLQAVRTCTANTRNEILDCLIKAYWKPLYYYARRKGHAEEDAKDLIQGFFLACIEHDFFARADRERARFRTFLRTSFDHYSSNVRRAAMAKRRSPPGGMLSLDELMAGSDDRRPFEPREDETPEDVFNRIWARDLLLRVLRIFREECRTTGKEKHCRIFELRIIGPAMEGAEVPSLQQLAKEFDMTTKQAANCLLTARRAFQRLLREVIRTYAFSEHDVTTEMHELMRSFE